MFPYVEGFYNRRPLQSLLGLHDAFRRRTSIGEIEQSRIRNLSIESSQAHCLSRPDREVRQRSLRVNLVEFLRRIITCP
ncbi:MAG: hypothetical protein JWN04_4976 [Myxococcaceae bacterium]|nr:hypothetical protein [Myxococcaceae bacterium]